MKHPGDGEIAALLDGELTEDRVRRRVAEHVEECDRCARRRDELADISARLDATLERGLQPPADLTSGPREAGGTGRYAGLKAAAAVAALVTVGALAADAALPGSPIRDLVMRAAGELPGVDRPVARVESPGGTSDRTGEPAGGRDPGTDDSTRPARRGLAVSPAGGVLVLRISGAAEGTAVRVALSEEPRGRISARGGTFRTDPGRLELVDPAPGEVRVTVPRAGEWRIEIDSLTVLSRTGGRLLRADGRAVDGRTTFLLRVGEPPGR